MPPLPVPADLPPDPMPAEERAAWLDRVAEQDEPPGLEEWPDPEEELTAVELAEIGEAAAGQMLAIEAAATGRRGPGQRASAASRRRGTPGCSGGLRTAGTRR